MVVYFQGELGKGKLKWVSQWEDLPTAGLLNKAKGGLWDNVGLGGSQKGEVAFLDSKSYAYDEIDFGTFMGHYLTYEAPAEVEAETKSAEAAVEIEAAFSDDDGQAVAAYAPVEQRSRRVGFYATRTRTKRAAASAAQTLDDLHTSLH